MAPIIEINDLAHYKKQLSEAGDKLVVVDFYADWCGPCKRIAPALKDLAEKYPDSLQVLKVNVDDAEDVGRDCNIKAMPTFFFYKNAQKIDELTGANEPKLREKVEKHTQ